MLLRRERMDYTCLESRAGERTFGRQVAVFRSRLRGRTDWCHPIDCATGACNRETRHALESTSVLNTSARCADGDWWVCAPRTNRPWTEEDVASKRRWAHQARLSDIPEYLGRCEKAQDWRYLLASLFDILGRCPLCRWCRAMATEIRGPSERCRLLPRLTAR